MKKIFYIVSVICQLIVFQQCKSSKSAVAHQASPQQELSEKELEKSNVTSLFIDANKERLLGNLSKAMQLYQQCIERNPSHAPSYYEISRMLQAKFNMPEAIKMAKKAAELDSSNKWFLSHLATLYQSTGQNALAANIYRELLALNPGNLDYSYELADLYMRMKQYMSAIAVLNEIEKQTGTIEEISVQKQKLYLLSGNFKDAIAETERLSATFPNEPRYYSMLAELHLSNKNYEKALQNYNKVLILDPSNPYIRISLAEYYKTIGNKNQSAIELKKGFANPNLDVDTKIQVMISFYGVDEIYTKYKIEAMELARVLVETHPADPKANTLYADFLIKDEKYEEARQSFRKAINIDPSRYAIWETLLRLDIMLNDMESLEKDSQKAMELFPLQPLPYLLAGIGDHQTKRYEEAVKKFNSGKDLVVDDNELSSEFYMYLGDTYNQLKNYNLSDQSYEKSLKLKPDNPYVLNNYSYFLSLRKTRLDEAEAMAQRANELSPNNKHYLDTYAWVLYQKGNYSGALEWLQKALEHSGSDNAVVLEHFGDALYKLGRTREALEYWKKAKETGEGSDFLDKKIKDGILYE